MPLSSTLEKLSSAVVNMSWLEKPSRSTERGRSCLRHEPSARPVLGQHDLRIRRTSRRPARSASASRLWKPSRRGNSAASVTCCAVLRLEMVGEEARHLHDVRIGIVNDAARWRRAWFLRLRWRELSMSVDISKAVQQLLEARRSGVQVTPPFALPDRAAVYAIQDGVAAATGPVSGWKVGARTPTAEPNPAPLLAGALVKSPASVRRQGDAHDRRRDRDLLPHRARHRRRAARRSAAMRRSTPWATPSSAWKWSTRGWPISSRPIRNGCWPTTR